MSEIEIKALSASPKICEMLCEILPGWMRSGGSSEAKPEFWRSDDRVINGGLDPGSALRIPRAIAKIAP